MVKEGKKKKAEEGREGTYLVFRTFRLIPYPINLTLQPSTISSIPIVAPLDENVTYLIAFPPPVPLGLHPSKKLIIGLK